MPVRFSLCLCLVLLVGCEFKYERHTSESHTTTTEVSELPSDSTSTCVDTSSDAGEEEGNSALMVESLKDMVLHPDCFSPESRVSQTLRVIDMTVKEMVGEKPGPQCAQIVQNAKDVFALQTDVRFVKIAIELIDLYQSMDRNKQRTILEANRRLSAIESTPEMAEPIRLVKEAILREALVYTYIHASEKTDDADSVLGPYVFERVQDRLEFAKDVVNVFEAQFPKGAIPLVFLTDASLNDTQRKKLIEYLLSPWDDVCSDTDVADDIEQRASRYVALGYDATEVNAVAVAVLVENDLFNQAIAYANKHFSKDQVTRTENLVIEIMRERGCYSIVEDANGQKSRLYNFTEGCKTFSESETEE